MDLLLFIFFVEMCKKPDCDEFLVGQSRRAIVTQALKTSGGTSIVNLTDKQIKFD